MTKFMGRMMAEVYTVEEAAFRLMTKFHHETECGQDHMHWAECDALVDALGYDSWQQWIEQHALVTEALA